MSFIISTVESSAVLIFFIHSLAYAFLFVESFNCVTVWKYKSAVNPQVTELGEVNRSQQIHVSSDAVVLRCVFFFFKALTRA